MIHLILLALLTMVSCSKTYETGEQTEADCFIHKESMSDIELYHHIVSFIDTCEYWVLNTSGSSGLTYSWPQLVNEIESALNLKYGFYISTIRNCCYKSLISTDSIQDSNVSVSHVSMIYDQIRDTLANQYHSLNDTLYKLICVDLAYDSSDDLIEVVSLFGLTEALNHTNKSWLYGDLEGACDGTYQFEWDAAKQLELQTNNYFYEEPPTNCQWYFPEIDRTIYDNPPLYRNPDDEILDNYLDYLLFYATSQLDPLPFEESTLCLYKEDEMPFYKTNYINWGSDIELNTAPNRINKVEVYGSRRSDDTYSFLFHKVTYYHGRRLTMCLNNPPYPVDI